jgi:hypothetical protein
MPGLLRARADERGSIFPVAKPDVDDLDRFMFDTDSPYQHRRTGDGGIEIVASGRSAVTLLTWLEDVVSPAPRRRA